jgi:hypothetical protein
MRNLSLKILLAVVVALAGCGKSKSVNDADAGQDATTEPEYLDEGDPVHGLDITEISIYQGVKIPLMDDWVDATDFPVPLVIDRKAMVRVHVKRQTQWQPHDIVAQVDIESDQVETEPIQWITSIAEDSAEYDLNSTINLPVPASYIAADSRITVSLLEWSGGILPKGHADKSRWPIEGSFELFPDDSGAPLQLVLVPVRYWADESGRYPDTSPPQLQRFIDAIYYQYPTRGVEVTVLEPIDWYIPIVHNGAGWGEVLSEIMSVRAATGAQTEEYYYGLFQPADTLAEYCDGACVAGMSNLAVNPSDFWGRSSVGLGYPGDESADTMVHEVGHAHGREHAPCEVSDFVDPFYPHPGGVIGAWGYDLDHKEIKEPNLFYDFMSYCNPTWISDYTYNALYDRIVAVNALASKKGPSAPAEPWFSIQIGLDGTSTAGPVLDLGELPVVRQQEVELLGDDGDEIIGTTWGYFQPFSDPPAGLVLFPEPPLEATRARLPNGDPVPIVR